MTESSDFAQALHAWSRTFMRQSIHEMLHFSKGTGLSMPQVSTLFHLHRANECGVSNIGEHLGVTNAAASQMIDRLVQQGLIERIENPTFSGTLISSLFSVYKITPIAATIKITTAAPAIILSLFFKFMSFTMVFYILNSIFL